MREAMKNNPLVSIVIPTYNHAAYLKDCLSSLVSQSYVHWQAIVVNNFSSDNTENVVKGFGDDRICLINFRNNGIIAASRNEGIRRSTGEFIAFLDSDDWWYPDKLQSVSGYFDSSDIIFHDLDIVAVKRENGRSKAKGRHLKKPVFVDLMLKENALPNSSVLVRKEIIERVGGLDEDPRIISAEDFDLWLKISRITEQFTYLPQSLGAYRLVGLNMSSSMDRFENSIKEVYSRHLPFLNSRDRLQAGYIMNYCLARIMLNKKLYDRAVRYLKEALGIKRITIKLKAIALICLINLKREKLHG
jgi:glycosyltransferase involved in cell wall biosynthesis